MRLLQITTVLTCCLFGSLFADKEIMLTDLPALVDRAKVSPECVKDKWQIMPYATKDFSGTLLWAYSYTDAPELTLDIKADGWYSIYVGVWQPPFAGDESESVIKLKLTGEEIFQQMQLFNSPDNSRKTFISEYFVSDADLTGKKIILAKANGPGGKPAGIAFVRLVPLSKSRIAEILDERKNRKRNLTATIDGWTFFSWSEYRTPEQLKEMVEPYRYSDVGKVLWAVNYGALTGYPSKVKGTSFLGDRRLMEGLDDIDSKNLLSQKITNEIFRNYAEINSSPPKVIGEHAHKIGIKFDIMLRIGILGGTVVQMPLTRGRDNFFKEYPNVRLRSDAGMEINKASYAYPQTQDFMLALMKEAVEEFNPDGVNLCMVRGPHLLWKEGPIVERFQKKYGENPAGVSGDDPRMQAIRAEIMTEFMQKARKLADDIGKKRGRPLEVSVWVWPQTWNLWPGKTPQVEGLDVKTWISQKLVDSVICESGIDKDYMALCKKHGVKFVLYTGHEFHKKGMNPKSILNAYQNGVKEFAYWDTDSVQHQPQWWAWVKDVGHPNIMRSLVETPQPAPRTFQILRLDGMDVENGLSDSNYSGG